MKLHEKIKAIRRAKNITQSTIALRLNITVQAYSFKENGKRPITTNELEIIASVLEVPASIFFEEDFYLKLNKTTA